YCEDLAKASAPSPLPARVGEAKRKGFELLVASLLALGRENKENLWSSMIKDTMKRKKPSFNETYHGYRTFSELLLDAQKEGLLELDIGERSRTYVVTRFGAELQQQTPPATLARRRRRRRPRSRSGDGAAKPAERPAAA